MKSDPTKHPIALLRGVAELSQKDLAALAECSVFTIRSIEQRRLKLSFHLAERIADETGVDVGWLLDGKPTIPIVEGKPYTREDFSKHRAYQELLELDLDSLHASRASRSDQTREVVNQVRAFLESTEEQSNHLVLCWEFRRFLEKQIEEQEKYAARKKTAAASQKPNSKSGP